MLRRDFINIFAWCLILNKSFSDPTTSKRPAPERWRMRWSPTVTHRAGIKRESLIARAVDLVFGYDFFVSYSHHDGMGLPRRIKERLEQAGFRVFLDQTGYVAGYDLRRETRRQVIKSRKIVVIARPLALKSVWVRREVDVAIAHGKIPVIVDLNDAVKAAAEDAALAKMAREGHWLRLTETLADVDGEPTEHIISTKIGPRSSVLCATWCCGMARREGYAGRQFHRRTDPRRRGS
jgi:hypothetical protein